VESRIEFGDVKFTFGDCICIWNSRFDICRSLSDWEIEAKFWDGYFAMRDRWPRPYMPPTMPVKADTAEQSRHCQPVSLRYLWDGAGPLTLLHWLCSQHHTSRLTSAHHRRTISTRVTCIRLSMSSRLRHTMVTDRHHDDLVVLSSGRMYVHASWSCKASSCRSILICSSSRLIAASIEMMLWHYLETVPHKAARHTASVSS